MYLIEIVASCLGLRDQIDSRGTFLFRNRAQSYKVHGDARLLFLQRIAVFISLHEGAGIY